jgi:hypothetical protein
MTPTITTTAAPDQSEKALQIITLMLSLDPEAQSETLARIIAATIHDGPGSALERFAATGHFDPETMLEELNDVRVPFEREDWVDALGRYVLFTAGDRS